MIIFILLPNQTHQMINTNTVIHIMALDGKVNVNSLFTLALFLGLTFNPYDPNYTLIDTKSCLASKAIAESLVSFHIYSFSFFLFSSLFASGLKLAIRNTKNGDNELQVNRIASVNMRILRVGILTSAVGSTSGCVFLMLAPVELVQVKLGILACWSWYNFLAICPLVILVPSALVIYISEPKLQFLNSDNEKINIQLHIQDHNPQQI